MISTSKEFGNKIRADTRTFYARILVDGTPLESDIKNITCYKGSCGNNIFTIGAVYAHYAEIELNAPVSGIGNKIITVEIGLETKLDSSNNPVIEYVQLGRYTRADVKNTAFSATINATSLLTNELKMLYAPKISFPTTIKSILNDIEVQIGITIQTDFDTSGVIEISPKGYTYQEILGYLAGCLGGFVTEDSSGKIVIAKYSVTPTLETDAGEYIQMPEFAPEPYKITGITVTVKEDGETDEGDVIKGKSYSAGTDENRITVYNPFMTQSLFDVMKKNVIGLSWFPGKATLSHGDARLEATDVISVTDVVENNYIIPCMNLAVRFDGGVWCDIEAPGEEEKETSSQGPLTQLLEKYYADLVLAKEMIAKRATIEELEATNAFIQQLSANSVTTGQLNATNARIEALEADSVTVNYVKANYADINLSNIAKGTIKTAMIAEAAISTALIADGSITDAKIVELTANKITAGTLSVERLEIRGSENSIVYELNNITGALQSKNVDTLNGEILTPRSITADKIVANAITAREIASNSITSEKINVSSLEAICARIGGFTIGDKYLANNTESIGQNQNSVYIGTDGISCGTDFKVNNDGSFSATKGNIAGWEITANNLHKSGDMEYTDTDGATQTVFTQSYMDPRTLRFMQKIDANKFASVEISPGDIYMYNDDTEAEFDLSAIDETMLLYGFKVCLDSTGLFLWNPATWPEPDSAINVLNISNSKNLVLGYGKYEKAEGSTNIYSGTGIQFAIKNPNVTWRPYYTKNESITISWYGAGYITSNRMAIHFSVPLAKPVVGASKVNVSNDNGLTIRQNGKYLYGSSADSASTSFTYTANLDAGGNSVHIVASLNDIEAVNNSVCGIYASLILIFS